MTYLEMLLFSQLVVMCCPHFALNCHQMCRLTTKKLLQVLGPSSSIMERYNIVMKHLKYMYMSRLQRMHQMQDLEPAKFVHLRPETKFLSCRSKCVR
ncbi:hypothetical protein CAG37_006365 [Serratia nematodiphila]|nr:hypothetical protein CAG37_006365 [Serratia nematodiphila]